MSAEPRGTENAVHQNAVHMIDEARALTLEPGSRIPGYVVNCLADALEQSIAYAINRGADLRLERDAAVSRAESLAAEVKRVTQERDTFARHLIRYHPKDECEILRDALTASATSERIPE